MPVDSINEPPLDLLYAGDNAKCDIIYYTLHLLLLRSHAHAKARRLANTAIVHPGDGPQPSPAPGVLQPILDMLQYEAFCKRVQVEVSKMSHALEEVGVTANVRFSAIGDTGEQTLRMFEQAEDGSRQVTGETVLRIDGR